MMAVTMLLIKFRMPTRAITMLMAYPITAEERRSSSYCFAIVWREVYGHAGGFGLLVVGQQLGSFVDTRSFHIEIILVQVTVRPHLCEDVRRDDERNVKDRCGAGYHRLAAGRVRP